MRIVFTIVILFAFTMGAIGLPKVLNTNEQQSYTIAQANSLSEVMTKSECCSSEEETSETQQPRCIGDICIDHEVMVFGSIGIPIKLASANFIETGIHVPTSFLRPPIA